MTNLRKYITTRLLQLVVTFFIILTMLFFLLRLSLPDPSVLYVREGLGPEEQLMMKKVFGLDLPLHEQYALYVANFLRGELGISFHHRIPVSLVILDRIPNTLILMLPAIGVAYLVGGFGGAFFAWRRGKKVEKLGIIGSLLFHSAPVFWVGMVSILLFSVWLGWLPAGGIRTPPYTASNFLEKILNLDFLAHWLLPFSILTLALLAHPLLLMRNTMLEVVESDFIELCWAKGLSESSVLYTHAARNALLPLVTQTAISIGLSLGGSVAVEVVFSWPGLGREIFQAIRSLDFPLAQGTFMAISLLMMVLNLFVDLLYGYLDPRVSYG